MLNMEIVKGKMANAMTSTAQDHVIAVAADIYDESLGKYQSQINAEGGPNPNSYENIKDAK